MPNKKHKAQKMEQTKNNILEPLPGRSQVEFNQSICLELVGYVTCPEGFVGQKHNHPFWEVIYVAEGTGEFEVGNKTYPVKENQICLISPDTSHQFINKSNGNYSNLYIGFSVTPDLPTKDVSFFVPPYRAKNNFEELTAKLLKSSKSQRDNLLAASSEAIITELLNLTQFIRSGSKPLQESRSQVITRQAKQYLLKHLNRVIKVEEVAALFYLSPKYVADLFKQETGQSLKQYHHSLRMNEAHRLLKEGNMTISEISDHLGFDSIHYFSKRFSSYFGTPPSKVK